MEAPRSARLAGLALMLAGVTSASAQSAESRISARLAYAGPATETFGSAGTVSGPAPETVDALQRGALRSTRTVPPAPRVARIQQMLQRFSRTPSAAWPTVRAYVWETCFEPHDLFVGYAQSRPGLERPDRVTFHLMVDSEAWGAMTPDERRATLRDASVLFEASLAELGLEGSLAVMTVSR